MNKLLLISILLISCIGLFTLDIWQGQKFQINEKASVENVLRQLGDQPVEHQLNLKGGASAKIGEELFKTGFAKRMGGRKKRKQSKHFVCTSCHNITKEDPDLSVSDPQARLEYADKMGLPFLQGTSLYGAVNRTNFYNGDYYKKYGNLVEKANDNLREAIQLCAVECAQGRRLANWELESILGYLWSLELKMGDLNLTAQDYQYIENAIGKSSDQKKAIELIKSKYLQASPATFTPPPTDRKKGYGLTGDPKNGKLIYELSCLHCHQNQRYSFFNLDESKLSLDYLNNHFPKYSHASIYQVGRYGTPPLNGKRSYMPQYTAERMSNQQMEDLRAYLAQGRE